MHQPSGLYVTTGDGEGVGGRFYDSATGRWINRDPLGENEGPNLYGYVGDSPDNYNDPQGLFAPTPPPVRIPPVVVEINPFFAAAYAGYVTGELINAVGESTGAYNAIAQEIVRKQLHRQLGQRTHQKPPSGMTPCEEAEWSLERLQDILQLRRELAILHVDNEPNHAQE